MFISKQLVVQWAALFLIALRTSTASAALVGGTIPSVVKPSDTSGGNSAFNVRRIFVERNEFQLTSDLFVDYLSTISRSDNSQQTVAPGTSALQQIISKGTVVNSYYVYIDPTAVLPFQILDWTVIFSDERLPPQSTSVIGLIYTPTHLKNSDFLGSAGTDYHAGETTRGLETGDLITIDALGQFGITTITAQLDGSDPFDALRIIERTTPVPLPLPLLLFGSAIVVTSSTALSKSFKRHLG